MEAWYRYDAAKQRTRKRVKKQGELVEERFYLGGLEWYRRARTLNGALVEVEEIETLHLFDGEHRLLMVDQVIKTDRANLGISNLYRYTLSNHLGSSTVEVDENADVISYEEYHPYGTTAYQSGRNAAEVKLKRYRYTGMERDEESGLSYHGARYYAPWLGRWGSCDQTGLADGPNVYSYVNNNSILRTDSSGHQGSPPPASKKNKEHRLPVTPMEAKPKEADWRAEDVAKIPTAKKKFEDNNKESKGFFWNTSGLTTADLKTIDEALKSVTDDNPALQLGFYQYYSKHRLEKSDTRKMTKGHNPQPVLAETSEFGNTTLFLSAFEDRTPDGKRGAPDLGGVLLHELEHTGDPVRGGLGADNFKEGSAYAVEKLVAERVKNQPRVDEITKTIGTDPKLGEAKRKLFRLAPGGVNEADQAKRWELFHAKYDPLIALYEVIDQGHSSRKEKFVAGLTPLTASRLAAELGVCRSFNDPILIEIE